jgi:hypothetical protein
MERLYKWEAHQRWNSALGRTRLGSLLDAGELEEIATTAVGIESRTNLLFSVTTFRTGHGPLWRPTAHCSTSRKRFAPTWPSGAPET